MPNIERVRDTCRSENKKRRYLGAMMEFVYILEHSYENEYGNDETKFIGVYTSEEEAKAAIQRLVLQPGFRERPEDFHIGKIQLNRDHWDEGYVRIETIWVKTTDEEWVPVQAAVQPGGMYELLDTNDIRYPTGFKFKDLVKCENKGGELYAIEPVTKK
jgi:hypothetical protein